MHVTNINIKKDIKMEKLTIQLNGETLEASIQSYKLEIFKIMMNIKTTKEVCEILVEEFEMRHHEGTSYNLSKNAFLTSIEYTMFHLCMLGDEHDKEGLVTIYDNLLNFALGEDLNK